MSELMTAPIRPETDPVQAESLADPCKQLQPHHRAELYASGINDDMIALAGIYSASDREIAAILGWQPNGVQWGQGWVVPFGSFNERSPYARVKLDAPRHGKDGEIIKYESPPKTPNRVYVPPGFWDAINEPKTAILITEGEKKALAAMQRGFAALGLVGVWGFAQKRKRRQTGTATGPRLLLPELNRIHWDGRRVDVVFDSDVTEKSEVAKAERELAGILAGRGADVRVIRLPQVGEGKTGLDDFLVQHGDAANEVLGKLLEAAAGVAPEADPPDRLPPFKLADVYISQTLICDGQTTARHWRDEFHQWNGQRYGTVSIGDFTKRVLVWLDQQMDGARPGLANEVTQCIAARLLIGGEREQPQWLGPPKSGPRHAADWISLGNGILDLAALWAGQTDVLHPLSPLWFSANGLPYHFDPLAQCPRWLEFLNEVLEADAERLALLQQWFGYNLIPDTSFHKFIVLIGEGANGKTVVLQVLEGLLGSQNVSHVPLEMFGQRFALWPTIGKLANLVAELGEVGRTDEGVVKAVVDGSPIEIDRKNLPLLALRSTSRITIATNTLPRWTDRSDGIWRRQIAIPFRVKIPEHRQDRQLGARIIASEMSGVLNWSLAGLHGLQQAQQFVMPAVCAELGREHRLESNPAKMFLTSECSFIASSEIVANELYAAYSRWAVGLGYRPLGEIQFGHEIGRVYPQSERFKRRIQGREVYHRSGIHCPLAAINAIDAINDL